MSNSTVDYPRESSKHSIVIVDDEPLSQDCLAEAMRGEFPELRIIGSPTVHDLYRPKEAAVVAILLKIKSQSVDLYNLAQDIRSIGRHFIQAPVIVISPRDDVSSIEAAVAAGAQGLIPISASFKIAVAAVRLVLAGGTYYPRPHSCKINVNNGVFEVAPDHAMAVPPDMLTQLGPQKGTSQVDFADEIEVSGLNAAFTAREVDVLAALRKGRSNKWIAHHLNLSENTIKVHIRHIMRKLRATNRTEAVVLSQGLIADSWSTN